MNVIAQKMSVLVEDEDEVVIDLTKPQEEIDQQTINIKEGCTYRIKLYFTVQHEIVNGLKYFHSLRRKGIQVDKMDELVGNYGAKDTLQSYTSEPKEAGKGIVARGHYLVKSKLYCDG